MLIEFQIVVCNFCQFGRVNNLSFASYGKGLLWSVTSTYELRLKLLIIRSKSNCCQIGKNQLNPFPNKPWFLHVCSTSLLKTLWKKEKLLVTSNFSFSHSVFYLFEELFCHFRQLSNCRLQTVSVSKRLNFVIWERVNLSGRLIIQSVCTNSLPMNYMPEYIGVWYRPKIRPHVLCILILIYSVHHLGN